MSSLPPLTHHEILRLAEPFSRQGWRADLNGEARVQRRIGFQPRRHEHADLGPITEHVHLESPGEGKLRLVRRLDHEASGLQASLTIEGRDAATLLACLAQVPVERQLLRRGRCPVAFSHRVSAMSPSEAPALVLRRAAARVGGVELGAAVSSVTGYPAELDLRRVGEGVRTLPEDLFAVLGSRWDRLVPTLHGWKTSIALRGPEPRRTEQAESRMLQAIEHLERTLAAEPAEFHARHRWARWRVALGEAVPVSLGVGIVALAIGIQQWWPERSSWIAMLANLAPPVLMALFFMRREMPRIGLPRFPRRVPATAWQPAAAAMAERS